MPFAKHLRRIIYLRKILPDVLSKRNLLTHLYDEANTLEAQDLIINHFSPTIANITQALNKKATDEGVN